MDPWKDVQLSLDPMTRDRHAYAGSNPIGYVDVNGHRPAPPGGTGGFGCHYTGKCVQGPPAPKHIPTNTGGGSGGGGGSTGGAGSGGGGSDLSTTISYIGTHKAETAKLAWGNVKGLGRAFWNGGAEAASGVASCAGSPKECAGAAKDAAVRCAGDVGKCGSGAVSGAQDYASGCLDSFVVSGEAAGDACVFDAATTVATAGVAKIVTKGAGKFGKGGGCHSFAASTLVLMADGSRKPINAVQVGDWVLAANEATGADPQPRRVTAVWKHQDKLMHLYTSAGRITTTSDHLFYNRESGHYDDASKLAFGSRLRSADASRILAWGHGQENMAGTAYNLTVDERHTYYVGAGRSSALVHNTKGCGSFDDFAAAGDDIPGFKQPGRPGGMSGAQRDFNAMNVGDEVWDYSKTGMPFIRGVDSTGSTIVWRPWSSGNVPTIQNTTTGGKIRYP